MFTQTIWPTTIFYGHIMFVGHIIQTVKESVRHLLSERFKICRSTHMSTCFFVLGLLTSREMPHFSNCFRFNKTKYSKTPIYRAPIYRVPRFTGPQFYPPKTISVKCTPIYSASRFTGPNSFPPRGPVNRGFTVICFLEIES